MASRSPLDYDVSVLADKRRRQRARGFSGAFDTSQRSCEWPGCDGHAKYRAPHSPTRLNDYRWFCLDHVRAYNAGWNFFAECSEAEIDAQFQSDRTWERPTWKLGKGPKGPIGAHPHAEGNAWARWGFRDPFEVLGEAATLNPGAASNENRPRRRMSREEQRAMDTLGLPHQVEILAEVRARYRELVKDLHPDMNGGHNPEPERLARVLRAWKVLRKSRNFKR
jgi:hypothetical protein